MASAAPFQYLLLSWQLQHPLYTHVSIDWKRRNFREAALPTRRPPPRRRRGNWTEERWGTLLFTCPVCHSWRTSSPSRHTRTECPNQQVLSSSSFFSYPVPSEINKWWRCYRFLLLMSLLFNNSTPFFSFPVKWCIVAASSPCVATGLPWRHTQLQ